MMASEIHHSCGATPEEKNDLDDLLSFQVMDDNFEITFLI